jgi:type II secretory ATPase GspE/PulE/Tfp pilus assembly ATPase PilB-like protein
MSERLIQLLLRARVLRAEDLGPALRGGDGRPLPERLAAAGLVSEATVAQVIADALTLPTGELRVPTPAALDHVPRALAERHLALPLAVDGPWLEVAMADPLDLDARRDLEFRSGLRLRPLVATPGAIRGGIARAYTGATSGAGGAPFENDPILDADRSADPAPAVQAVHAILAAGIDGGASDVHVEPAADGGIVRIRVDGLLHDALRLPPPIVPAVVSRLKILARLDIADRRRPQDGRLRVRRAGRVLDVRVSTLPTHLGEKVVLRLLDPACALIALDALGLPPAQRGLLEAALDRPQGAVLVTGPTGSGKTSTLYASLLHRRSPGINIVTLENPVEFQLPGLTQVQVNERAGLTFAASLRSVVRQDPDVIMVGEIRDPETAEIAFQAALTGHLVLSTLHTNGAAAAVTRLLDLGVEPFLVASSVTLVVAQRLVRRLCAACRVDGAATAVEHDALGLARGTPVFRAGGCARCRGAGFRGRTGVFECLPVDGAVRELVVARAPEARLEDAARARGCGSLVQAAADAVRAGTTSPDEVLRVIAPLELRAPGV